MKRSSSRSSRSSRSSKRRARTIDVSDPSAVLAWFDATAREQERHRGELERQGALLEAVVERLNEVVAAVNRIIDAGAGVGAPAPGADPPVPSVAATPAPAPAAVSPAPAAGWNVRTLLPAILAKNPALADKLAQLGGCGAPHGTFTMGCSACQQGALARVAASSGL